MPVVKDRRSSPRVEIDGRARIDTDRDRFDGQVVDLGLHGIAIRSSRAARPAAQVTLELLVDGQRLRVEATVARRQRTGGEYLLGLAFVDLDLDAQRHLEHWVFERLAGSPQAEIMRAFVAHAERVPPPAAGALTADRTVVVGALPVPVISGHTQVIAVGRLPVADHTVIAPPPPRSETVLADAPAAAKRRDTVLARAPGVPDDAWLDDEMDTAQFRLLEAAQAREAAERAEADELEADEADEVDEVEVLDPEDPVPDHTVVVGGFALPPRERTLVTDASTERTPVERTIPLLPAAEHTVALRGAGRPEKRELTQTTTLPMTPAPERSGDAPTEPLPRAPIPQAQLSDAPAERTVPFLRDLLGPLGTRVGTPERTAVGVAVPPAQAHELSPTARALLEATALLQPADSTSARGPRVVVSVPHRTFRRVAPTPWNLR